MQNTSTPNVIPYGRLAVAPAEAACMLGLGKTKLYELMADNELLSIKIGTRRLIRVRDIESFLSRRISAD